MGLRIKKTLDFDISGDGASEMWKNTDWVQLPLRKGQEQGYQTDVKVQHSNTGLYFLFRCQDKKLTASLEEDFLDLYREDVVEVFIWPDERYPLYFEYELSPLNHELPLLIPNIEGNIYGWRPWHYETERLTRHATAVQGGKKESGSLIEGWTAEFFIPYILLRPLGNLPPHSGSRMRVNMYRCDYDSGEMNYWSWKPVENHFHEHPKFGFFIFE
jgi:hypothetical protein